MLQKESIEEGGEQDFVFVGEKRASKEGFATLAEGSLGSERGVCNACRGQVGIRGRRLQRLQRAVGDPREGLTTLVEGGLGSGC